MTFFNRTLVAMRASLRRSLIAAAAAAAALGAAGQAHANCQVTETVMNEFAPFIVAQMNAEAAGVEHRISKRKRLRINRVERIEYRGCVAYIHGTATLKRKIRRDAHGRFTLRAQDLSFGGNQLCMTNPRLVKLKLSRTSVIGEAAYRGAFRIFERGRRCYS